MADIARELDIKYQHARHVLDRSGLLVSKARDAFPTRQPQSVRKASLTVEALVGGGPTRLGCWLMESEQLLLESPAPRTSGVYAFTKDGVALYVGVSVRGLSQRLGFYSRPGKTQKTSLRLNAMLKQELSEAATIQVYVATPPDLEWNGLPVSGAAGLELGLIQKFDLPWNKRSAG